VLSPIIFLFSLVRSVVDPSAAVTFVNLAAMSLLDQIPILTTAKIAMLPSAQAAVLGAGEATALTADQAEALAKGEAIQLTPEQVNAMAGERAKDTEKWAGFLLGWLLILIGALAAVAGAALMLASDL
jgi:hypothetical protein